MLSIQIDTKSLEVGCSPTVQQIQIVLLCTLIRYSRANVVNHQKRTFPNEKHKHAQNIFSDRGCQAVVQQAWRRGFVRLDMITCIFGIFLPFLVWTPLVKFQPGLGDNGGSLNPFQKVYVFYKCPFVKYCGICISYFCFITLFSYVALFGYRWHYQIPEIGLYAWILILITGEVRELLKEPSHTLKGKWNSYISNMWNKIDVFFVCMAFLAFFLRHFWYTFWYSRIVFAFNCGVYYLRIFRTYHASQRLGPKLVIFQKMVRIYLPQHFIDYDTQPRLLGTANRFIFDAFDRLHFGVWSSCSSLD